MTGFHPSFNLMSIWCLFGCSIGFTIDATTVPHKPKSVEVRVAGDNALSVAIEPPDDDGGANITHYQVDTCLGNDQIPFLASRCDEITVTGAGYEPTNGVYTRSTAGTDVNADSTYGYFCKGIS